MMVLAYLTVTFIEMFTKKLPEASACDSLGLGVDVDVNPDVYVDFVIKDEEWDDDAMMMN